MCAHKRTGIVVNETQAASYNPALPHAAANCCDRPECRQQVMAWVSFQTNDRAVFKPDQH